MEEKEIGRITHYFSNLGVAVVELTNDTLSVGDKVHIKGHTTDLTEKVDSLQIEHDSVQSIKVGDAAGIKVNDHVREHDIVYKVQE